MLVFVVCGRRETNIAMRDKASDELLSIVLTHKFGYGHLLPLSDSQSIFEVVFECISILFTGIRSQL
jgi:hypothetical protein